jgi:hypothetical protein
MMVTMLAYSISKGRIMLFKDKPLISAVVDESVREIDDVVYIDDYNFKFAFNVQPADIAIAKDDPEYVEWAPYIVTVEHENKDDLKSDLRTHYEPIGFHTCNETDWT